MRLASIVLPCLFAWSLFALEAAQLPGEPQQSSISGTVSNGARGEVIRDADVFAIGQHNSVQLKTDEKGSFRAVGLTSGSYRLIAVTDHARGPSGEKRVQLAAGRDLRSVEFILKPVGSLSGRVLGPHRQPLAGMTVSLVAREYRWGALHYITADLTETDEHGNYKFQGVSRFVGYLVLASKTVQSLDSQSADPEDPQSDG